jgi:hypothetical protein
VAVNIRVMRQVQMEEKSVQVAETQASDDISKTSPIHLSRDANVTGLSTCDVDATIEE